MLEYNSIAALVRIADERGLSISRIVLEDQALDMGISENAVLQRMKDTIKIMPVPWKKGLSPISDRSADFPAEMLTGCRNMLPGEQALEAAFVPLQ